MNAHACMTWILPYMVYAGTCRAHVPIDSFSLQKKKKKERKKCNRLAEQSPSGLCAGVFSTCCAATRRKLVDRPFAAKAQNKTDTGGLSG